MKNVLRATLITMTADGNPSKIWQSLWLEVTSPGPIVANPRWTACLPEYQLMCDAVMSDVTNAESAVCVEKWIEKVESGELELADVDGNGWVINVTRDKVWFEGLHGQDGGGEVSLSQFKLALKTYKQFLSDPEHKPIEIAFPV